MSLLDDLLASLDVEVRTFSLCKIENGSALSLGANDAPIIHYGLKGSGIARFPDGTALAIEPHDFALVPPRRPHRIDSEGDHLRIVPAVENCVVLADGMLQLQAGTDPDLIMVCGKIEATCGETLGLFDRLDRPVSVRLRRSDRLRQAFEAMLDELASPIIGTRALTDALLKQCLVLLVRRLVRGEREPAWLAGLVDSRLASVVAAVLADPGRDYTLKSLAEHAGMSRSGFARRFSVAFGTTPMEFVKGVRLRSAARLLRSTDLPVATVANKVGYGSRTHFSRAFRAAFGKEPQSFRAGK